jgi:hypothetical protein
MEKPPHVFQSPLVSELVVKKEAVSPDSFISGLIGPVAHAVLKKIFNPLNFEIPSQESIDLHIAEVSKLSTPPPEST